MSNLNLNRFKVVLVEPRVPENVGSVARLLENYAVGDAVLVNPQCEWREGKATIVATGPSQRRLLALEAVPNLKDAVSDCHFVVGFTARSGRNRQISIKLEDLGKKLPGKIGLVFGREDICLTQEETDLCSHLCTLDTAAGFPALNLSHSVAVALSQLFLQEHSSRRGHRTLATAAQLTPLFDHFRSVMVQAGLTQAGNPERMLSKLKKILHRSELSRQDVALVRGLLHRFEVTLARVASGLKNN